MKSVIIIAIAFVFFVGIGVGSTMYAFSVFPFDQGYYISVMQLFDGYYDPVLEELCKPDLKKYNFYEQVAVYGFTSDRVFIGDSIVEGYFDKNFFDINYDSFGSAGNIVECLTLVTDDILSLNPKKVLIYIGINDALGNGRQNPQEAIDSLIFVIDVLKNNDVEVILHGLNFGGTDVNRDFVSEFNDRLEKVAINLELQYIPPFDTLDFNMEDLTNNKESIAS